jgi:hypothetical protein
LGEGFRSGKDPQLSVRQGWWAATRSFLTATTRPRALARRSLGALPWRPITTALHKTGSAQPGGVYRVNFPRTDLSVTSDGVLIRPALSLGSYFTFSPLPTNPTAATAGSR